MLAPLVSLFGIVAVMAVLIAIFSIIRGFVLVKLWTWFIVPTFGLPAITMAPAIGLALVVGFLVYQYSSADAEADAKVGNSIFVSILQPALVLLIGWIVHLCM